MIEKSLAAAPFNLDVAGLAWVKRRSIASRPISVLRSSS